MQQQEQADIKSIKYAKGGKFRYRVLSVRRLGELMDTFKASQLSNL